jgi:MFS family permease
MNLVSSEALQPDRRRWATLTVVCLAQLMIVLDATIVNVALPSIQRELHFSTGSCSSQQLGISE